MGAKMSGLAHQAPEENAVQVSYDVSFTVLSIFTSLAGCATTLELLHRRTSTKGLFNWFLFIGACVAMGGSGIWSMHFIANRAIVIGDGDPERQIIYSPGFTALSVFLPVIVLGGAFYFLGTNRSRARPIYLVLAGVLTGTAVCGMHYVGNAGIRNYHCHYKPANVAGAAAIAVLASLVALSVFFQLRERWTDSWYKRVLCAFVLALAVCGMHWTAEVGTGYIQGQDDRSSGGTTRVQTVIVCAVLSLGCCLVLLATAFYRGVKVRIVKTRAQQVVLACAYFDESGRIMLTQEGSFPCQKITDRYVEKDFGEDELSRSHPTFLWIFRTSRYWTAVQDMIPAMAHHLESDQHARKYRPGRTSPTSDGASEVTLNFSSVFKQLFCVTAHYLSLSLHESLENLGVLFEEALETGTLHLFKSTKQHQREGGRTALPGKDIESNPFNLGRGKYLFLNRQLTKVSADRYAAMGYRFASIDQVAELVARNMDVKVDRMVSHLQRMQTSVSGEHLPPRGVHLACFMVRPSVCKSFDILVPSGAQNQLPMVGLKLYLLTTWHKQVIEKYDEQSVRQVLDRLVREPSNDIAERDFKFNFHAALHKLVESVGDLDFMLNATFSAKPIQVRTTPKEIDGDVDRSIILAIRIMNDIHAKPPTGMQYVPLSFFGAQQVIEAGADSDKERWARRIRMEFGYGAADSSKFPATALPQIPSSPWSRATFHEIRHSSTTGSSSGLRIFMPWRWANGRTGSHATQSSSRRDSGDDEARIVKTIEIDVKEEKDYSTMGMDSSVDDVARIMSAGSAGGESSSSPGMHQSHGHRRQSSTGPNMSIPGLENVPKLDRFERNQGDRGHYVANIESGVAAQPTTSGKSGDLRTRTRTRTGSFSKSKAGRKHPPSTNHSSTNLDITVPKEDEQNLEMIELDTDLPATPAASTMRAATDAAGARPDSSNGTSIGMGVRAGWVSEVFGMFRL